MCSFTYGVMPLTDTFHPPPPPPPVMQPRLSDGPQRPDTAPVTSVKNWGSRAAGPTQHCQVGDEDQEVTQPASLLAGALSTVCRVSLHTSLVLRSAFGLWDNGRVQSLRFPIIHPASLNELSPPASDLQCHVSITAASVGGWVSLWALHCFMGRFVCTCTTLCVTVCFVR